MAALQIIIDQFKTDSAPLVRIEEDCKMIFVEISRHYYYHSQLLGKQFKNCSQLL